MGQTQGEVRSDVEGEVRFGSRYAQYRHVIRAPIQTYSPNGGVILNDPGLTVNFENYEFRTSDPEIITALRAPSLRGYVVELDPAEINPRQVERTQIQVTEALTTASATASFRCDVCGRAFRTKQNFEMHLGSKDHAARLAQLTTAAPAVPVTPPPPERPE